MRTIIKYVLLDLLRNRTIIAYTISLALLSVTVLNMDANSSKGMLSLLNISLLFIPITSILFATIYFFNSSEFIELLLCQPFKRTKVLLAQFLGLATALGASYFAGVGIPVMLFASGKAGFILILDGLLLTLIFSAFALLIYVIFRDKTKGIGVALITALFFSLLFDGLILLFIYSFSDYPIEKPLLGLISLNPIDLARITMLLQLDVAVLMGYSGALFKEFLGSATGTFYALSCLLLWVILPLWISFRIFKRKDL